MMNIYSKTLVDKVLAENPVQIRSLLEDKKVLWAWEDHGPSDFKTAWINLERLESKAVCKILAVTCLYQWLWAIDIHEEARKYLLYRPCLPSICIKVCPYYHLFVSSWWKVSTWSLWSHCGTQVSRNLSYAKGTLGGLASVLMLRRWLWIQFRNY